MKKFKITVNGTVYEVEVEEVGSGVGRDALGTPQNNNAPINGRQNAAPTKTPPPVATSVPSGATSVTAPMPGNILSVNVAVGDTVAEGDVVCVLEAMKMENEIVAPKSGTVASVNVAAGSAVNGGDVLVGIS